ncbi:MAG: hypothetical protein WDZ88_03055 [Candidatus Paceibacterota bacterium]
MSTTKVIGSESWKQRDRLFLKELKKKRKKGLLSKEEESTITNSLSCLSTDTREVNLSLAGNEEDFKLYEGMVRNIVLDVAKVKKLLSLLATPKHDAVYGQFAFAVEVLEQSRRTITEFHEKNTQKGSVK